MVLLLLLRLLLGFAREFIFRVTWRGTGHGRSRGTPQNSHKKKKREKQNSKKGGGETFPNQQRRQNQVSSLSLGVVRKTVRIIIRRSLEMIIAFLLFVFFFSFLRALFEPPHCVSEEINNNNLGRKKDIKRDSISDMYYG